MKLILTLLLLLTISSSTAADKDNLLLDFELECIMEKNWTYAMKFIEVDPIFDDVIFTDIKGTSNTVKKDFRLVGSDDGDASAMYEFLLEIRHDCNEGSNMKTIRIPFKDVAVYQKYYTFKFVLNITNKSGTLNDIPVEISHKKW